MKNIKYIALSAIAISLISGIFVFSAPVQTPNMCPAKPYPISSALTRTVQRIFGLNLLASKAAEHEIKSQIAKTVKGDVDVNLKTYSAFDLIAGKFKSAEIKAKNADIDGIYISSFEAKTLCDFVYINYKSNPVTPLAPVFVGFKGTITANDFNKTLASPKFEQNLTKIKTKINNADINLIDFVNPKVNISKGLISISTQIHLAGMPSYVNIPVKIRTGIKVENNKIKLINLKVLPTQGTNSPVISGLIESINPTIVDLNDLGVEGSRITIKNFLIENNKINVSGTVWMPAK